MKVVFFGATGMVGSSVLRQCLLDPDVEQVLAIGRNASSIDAAKLRNLVRPDMFDFDVRGEALGTYDACFFCLGVSSVGMSEDDYERISYQLTMGWARVLAEANPKMRFLYVSGMGTGGKAMWARVKGRTEDDLLALLPEATMIRLGVLRPMHGEHARMRGGRFLSAALGPIYRLVHWLWPSGVITSEELGRVMLRVAKQGAPKRALESSDLVALARDGAVGSEKL